MGTKETVTSNVVTSSEAVLNDSEPVRITRTKQSVLNDSEPVRITRISRVPFEERKVDIIKDIQSGNRFMKLKIDYVSLEQFKQFERDKETRLEKIIKRVDHVEKLADGYTYHFENGSGFSVFFDGSSQKISCDGKRYIRKFDIIENKNREDILNIETQQHYRVVVDRCSILVEKAIILADMIYKDSLPLYLRNLQCNVMDLSGNPDTAKKLGIEVNLHPDNLELCYKADNSGHYSTVTKLHKMYGKVYRVSALDRNLYELVANGAPHEIDWYIGYVNLPIVK